MKTGGDEGTMTVEALVGAAAPWWSNIMVRGSTLYEAAMMDTSRRFLEVHLLTWQ